MKRTILFLIGLLGAPLSAATITVHADSVIRVISPHLYGAGDEMDADLSGAGIDSLAGHIGVPLYRAGGIATEYFDWEANDYDGAGYIDFIDTAIYSENRHYGIDSILRFCERLGAEPVLTVNFQINDPGKAARLVEYCNGDTNTAMGRIRAGRGHPEPYNVTYWCVGNEPDISGTGYAVGPYTFTFLRHFGIPFDQWSGTDSSYVTPQTYAALFSAYADSMRARSALPLKIGAGLASELSWIEPVVGTGYQKMDWLDIHYYPSWCDGYDSSYTEWLAAPDRATLPHDYPPAEYWYALVSGMVAAYGNGKDIPVYVMEYNSGAAMSSRDDYWWGYLDGLFVADLIGHFAAAGVPKAALYSLHEGTPGADYPVFGMIRGDTLSVRSVGHVLKMYHGLFGDTLVRTVSDRVDSGNGLEAYGSLRGDTLAVIVINKNLDSAYETTIELPGFDSDNLVKVWDITNDTVLSPPLNGTRGIISRGEFTGDGTSFTRTLPRASVTMLHFLPGGSGELRQVALNGSFEMPMTADTTRPRYWRIGFTDSPSAVLANGTWALDSAEYSSGSRSLRLSSVNPEGFFLSQILDAPGYDLKGKTVSVSVDMKHQGTAVPPVVIVFASYPDVPGDSLVHYGTVLAADSPDWKRYGGSFVARDNANALAVMLATSGGTGSVWFDSLTIHLDVTPPGPAPSPQDAPVASRNYKIGYTTNDPANYSEKAFEDIVDKAASAGEVINALFHVKWCGLTGEDMVWSHQVQLEQVDLARKLGLDVCLTLDFTHDTPDSVGHINTAPAGTTVGTLHDPRVVHAYERELFGLCELVRPEYVMVGVEMDIFYEKHPDQWDAYVAMFKEVSDTLTARYPGIHVSVYFTLTWLYDYYAGRVDTSRMDTWRMLLPELQSIAYSVYPGTFGSEDWILPEGYFTAAREIAPDLPLILPEFGIPGGTEAPFDFDEQATLLSRMLTELETVETEFICWYSMYDQDFLGLPLWFSEAFGRLGMFERDGTPKKVRALWEAVRAVPLTTGIVSEYRDVRIPPAYGTAMEFTITGKRPVRHGTGIVITVSPDGIVGKAVRLGRSSAR